MIFDLAAVRQETLEVGRIIEDEELGQKEARLDLVGSEQIYLLLGLVGPVVDSQENNLLLRRDLSQYRY